MDIVIVITLLIAFYVAGIILVQLFLNIVDKIFTPLTIRRIHKKREKAAKKMPRS